MALKTGRLLGTARREFRTEGMEQKSREMKYCYLHIHTILEETYGGFCRKNHLLVRALTQGCDGESIPGCFPKPSAVVQAWVNSGRLYGLCCTGDPTR